MKASDLGVDSYENWTFDFSLQTSGDGECTGYTCADVFGKFSQCMFNNIYICCDKEPLLTI